MTKTSELTAQPMEKTACHKCGSFDFKQRSNATVEEEGYLDKAGSFVATSTEVDDYNAVFDLECMDCSASVEESEAQESPQEEDP